MPIKRQKQFTAWSYSRLDCWEGCSLKAKLKYLDKVTEEVGPALLRGSAIHKLAEKFALKRLKKLPFELRLFPDEFKMLRKISSHLQVEQQLGLNNKWQPCEWFGPQAWCRIVMDVMWDAVEDPSLRIVVDHKTGKINPKHRDQMELFTIGAFATAPKNITTVRSELWYLDQGEIIDETFERSDVPKLKKTWEKRAGKMLKDLSFKPKPSNLCRWCSYSKAKGGQCKY